jgi:phage gp46-like protein
MTDIRIFNSNGGEIVAELAFDIGLIGADLATDEGMETAVIMSWFSDAAAGPDDVLPQPGGDRRGWWADAYADVPGDVTGSKLWLLSREKQTQAVRKRAEGYGSVALAWMIADKVATAIDVVASFPQEGILGLAATITLPSGLQRKYAYQVIPK